MLQHTPTLYTHAERDVDSDEDDGWGDAVVGLESAAPFSALSTAASIGSPPPLGGISGNTPGVGPAASRIRLGRSRNSYSAASVGPSNVSFAALPTPGGGGGGVGGVGVTPGVGPSPGNGIPSSSSTSGRSASANTPRYSDLYSQFVQRYRSGANSHDVDPRSDPDSHFYQRGGGGILADQDSDDDDGPLSHSHLGLGHGHGHGLGLTHGKGMDGLEQRMAGLGLGGAASHPAGAGDVQPEPATVEQRERLEWQTMLASVLGGDVLKGEKTRIAGALASSAEEKNNMHVNVWLGLRSRLHGRAEAEERKRIEERRVRIVDDAIKGVLMFRIPDSSTSTSTSNDPDAPTASNGDGAQPTSVQAQPDLTAALSQVHAVLAKLDAAQALYPNLKAFYIDKPAALGEAFQARCDTLYTWSTVLSSLRKQIALLRKWTGSETLDVTEPNTDPEAPLGGGSGFRNLPTHHEREDDGNENGTKDVADGTTFVDRVLKEDSSQRTFEKGFLTTVHALIGTARDAQVNLAPWFSTMNLPTFEAELVPLISFPTRLVQAILRVRLDYAAKLRDPEVLIIDQIAEDLRVNIGLACTLKRQYEAFLAPDPGGNWNLPNCIADDYDGVVRDALTFFFELVHLKLKSGTKSIYFKETDILEGHWPTFNDVSLSTSGGSCLVAERLCAVTYQLLRRVTSYFDSQIRIPTAEDSNTLAVPGPAQAAATIGSSKRKKMNEVQMISWYHKLLESGKLRHRRLHRFARALHQRFCNSAEYSLEYSLDGDGQGHAQDMGALLGALVETDHFLVWTKAYMEEGVYLLASPVLREQPDKLRRIVTDAFHVDEVFGEDGSRLVNSGDPGAFMSFGPGGAQDPDEDMPYVLVLTPTTGFVWNGLTVFLEIPMVDLGMEDGRLRLIADGSGARLEMAKTQFGEVFEPLDEDGEPLEPEDGSPPLEPPPCIVEARAHLPAVHQELRRIARAANKLAELTVDSVHTVRRTVRGATGHQELLELWYGFASDHGQHAQKYMDRTSLLKFNRLLIKLAISWVSFICDDCDPNDRKTFRWAVNALEFALHRTRRNNILHLPDDQFELLRQKVASCMTLLISHFDILGARGTKEKERQEELLRLQTLAKVKIADESDEESPAATPPPGTSIEQQQGILGVPAPANGTPGAGAGAGATTVGRDAFLANKAVRAFWERTSAAISELESRRAVVSAEQHPVGRVLEDRPENRSLMFLAASSANISIRWQQGRFIGAGAFGSVYLAVNLDSGSLMAVKEIKFQELSGTPTLIGQIKDELSVMEMLHHPNVVEYYGIEVHRDKVYIFEEYCQGGSLAQLLEHGRIEDEGIIQVYTLQLLEGLAYLHSQGVVHRDIKPDNVLLDHMGVIKYVDFGAAKVLAKNHRTMMRTRKPSTPTAVEAGMMGPGPGLAPMAGGPAGALGGGLGMNNSLTGTPMYMSPEVIKNDKRGRRGAMDVWALGCVVLEFATGRKPWSNLDNEWAIMFHIGVAREHPPLPEPHQLSELGIDFIRQCLTIDAMLRPSADELMNHPWMLEFREQLRSYEEAELQDPPAEMPAEEEYDGASVARQAAIIQEKEVELIMESPNPSPVGTPDSTVDIAEEGGVL